LVRGIPQRYCNHGCASNAGEVGWPACASLVGWVGILAELVLEPSDGETVVITVWPSHQTFEAWIATPDRDRLTASSTHRAVDYHPITRYDVAGGYLNVDALPEEQS
jgi:hypothetical protein